MMRILCANSTELYGTASELWYYSADGREALWSAQTVTLSQRSCMLLLAIARYPRPCTSGFVLLSSFHFHALAFHSPSQHFCHTRGELGTSSRVHKCNTNNNKL